MRPRFGISSSIYTKDFKLCKISKADKIILSMTSSRLSRDLAKIHRPGTE